MRECQIYLFNYVIYVWLDAIWCRSLFKIVCYDTLPCHILRSGKSSENVGALDCLTCSGLDVKRAHRRGKSDSYVEYKFILGHRDVRYRMRFDAMVNADDVRRTHAFLAHSLWDLFIRIKLVLLC